MRNWHTKVIKLDKAKTIIAQKGLNVLGNSDIYVGVMEGSIEYVRINNSKPIDEENNYIVPNGHLNDGTTDKKIIFRKKIDSNFYDENLANDDNDKIPLTHTTSVAGVITGKEIDNDNVNVSGICPNVKIINALGKFENSLILSGINQYSKANVNSIHYQNEIIKTNNGSTIIGSSYFDYDKNIIPNTAKDKSNIYSQKKSAVINCSFSWPNDPIDYETDLNGEKIKVAKNMPAEITDFVMKELFAYGRDGRGVLTVFAAGNENTNNVYSLAHEVCHGLGLFHTHVNGSIKDPSQKYTYHYGLTDPIRTDDDPTKSTDNIMSYTPNRKTTWKWQWEIMHNHLKNYIDEI